MTTTRSDAAGEAVPEIALALRWSQTWQDRDAHYTARAATLDTPVGCIYRDDAGEWAWSMTADDYEISHNCGPTHGVEPSPRRAAKRVEDAWHSAVRGTRHEKQAPKINAYAAARYRHEHAA